MEESLQSQSQEIQKKNDYLNKVKHFRVSKSEFGLPILDIDEDIEEVVPMNNYKIFLYFDSGIIRIINAKNKGEILNGKEGTKIPEYQDMEQPDVLRYPFVYDENRICYLNTVKRKLEWFNTETFQFENLFEAQIPTIQGLSEQERNDAEKLESLYRDGTFIKYLKDSQQIILVEQKSAYSQNDQNIVLTAFHHSKSDQHVQQIVYQSTLHKMIYLDILNNTDKVAIWGQSFTDNVVEFQLWEIGQNPQNVKLSNKINGNVINICSWDTNMVAIFINLNTGDYPLLKIIDITQQSPVQEIDQPLNMFGEGEENNWCFEEILLCDYSQQKVIWERRSESGTYMDVYNPTFKQCTYSEYIGDDEEDEVQANLDKIASPNGKYLLGYNKDIEKDIENEVKSYPFVVNSVVSVGASLLDILKKSQLFEQYGEQFSQQVIELLLKK